MSACRAIQNYLMSSCLVPIEKYTFIKSLTNPISKAMWKFSTSFLFVVMSWNIILAYKSLFWYRIFLHRASLGSIPPIKDIWETLHKNVLSIDFSKCKHEYQLIFFRKYIITFIRIYNGIFIIMQYHSHITQSYPIFQYWYSCNAAQREANQLFLPLGGTTSLPPHNRIQHRPHWDGFISTGKLFTGGRQFIDVTFIMSIPP